MSVNLARTVDGWWVQAPAGMVPLDLATATTGDLLADREALDSAIRCWLMPVVLGQHGLTPTPTIVRQERFDPLFMVDPLPLALPDGPSCGSSGH